MFVCMYMDVFVVDSPSFRFTPNAGRVLEQGEGGWFRVLVRIGGESARLLLQSRRKSFIT